jgi:CBS-domain-containing membrane protein
VCRLPAAVAGAESPHTWETSSSRETAVPPQRARTAKDVARLMDDENVKRLPVVDDLGRLVGIVTRGDLLKVHLRPDDDIQEETEAVVRDEEVTARVSDGVVTLQGRVAVASTAEELVRLTRRIPGVVKAVDQIRYDYDDRAILATGLAYGAD